MRRVVVFTIALLVAIVALVVTVFWYLGSYQSGNSSVSGMMGQMMGNSNQGTNLRSMPETVSALLVFLIALAIIAVAGVAYYLTLPEIQTVSASTTLVQNGATVSPVAAEPKKGIPASRNMNWPLLIRTSKPEERKILEVLSAHGGKYLQKLIVKESGLSKLKTHRILSRFAERGIVTAQKSGNTNEISLADWLQTKKDGQT